MPRFESFADLRRAVEDLPEGDAAAADAVAAREATLTKPRESLGRLEELTAWLARWQGRNPPSLDRVEILVFAGNHGVCAQGVSAYPPEVTAQMVANFAAGGAAINQLARLTGASLTVEALDLHLPTEDFTLRPAMSERAFLDAVASGYEAVSAGTDLLILGEMGIGNTTAAAALCAGLFGGGAARFAGRGTGIDDQGLQRKCAVIETALGVHAECRGDPLKLAAALGGRELAAILGAAIAARKLSVPVLLDGFVCTAAVVPLHALSPGALDHAVAGHVSAEAGHPALLGELGLKPLLDLNMRLGEASGAAVALLVLRAALACHIGMATFDEAHVAKQSAATPEKTVSKRAN